MPRASGRRLIAGPGKGKINMPVSRRGIPDKTAKMPLLSLEEEQELGRRAIAGDQAARDRLIASNYGLVRHIAKRLARRGDPNDAAEKRSAGYLGLVEAAARYDPVNHPGIRFSTYASYWIKLELRRLYHEQSLVHVPDYLYRDELTRPAARSDASRKRATRNRQRAATAQHDILYFATGEDREDHHATGVEPPADPRSAVDLVEAAEERAIRITALEAALDQLPPAERTVLTMRYRLGQDGGRILSHRAVGDALGLTRGRVQQITQAALRHLRRLMPYGRAACA